MPYVSSTTFDSNNAKLKDIAKYIKVLHCHLSLCSIWVLLVVVYVYVIHLKCYDTNKRTYVDHYTLLTSRLNTK